MRNLKVGSVVEFKNKYQTILRGRVTEYPSYIPGSPKPGVSIQIDSYTQHGITIENYNIFISPKQVIKILRNTTKKIVVNL